MARSRTLLIFLSCLQKCTPSHCPVCRGVYRKEKIKKLHVETTIAGRDELTRASSPSAIAEYLQMVAMISGEGALDVDVEKVSARVDGWIASLPQNLKLQVSRRFFASTFFQLCFRVPHPDLRSLFCGSTILAVGLGMEKFLVLECPMLTKMTCYSRNRSVLRLNRSSGGENYSRTLKRPGTSALGPNES